jgi:hypothetical protein
MTARTNATTSQSFCEIQLSNEAKNKINCVLGQTSGGKKYLPIVINIVSRIMILDMKMQMWVQSEEAATTEAFCSRLFRRVCYCR